MCQKSFPGPTLDRLFAIGQIVYFLATCLKLSGNTLYLTVYESAKSKIIFNLATDHQ